MLNEKILVNSNSPIPLPLQQFLRTTIGFHPSAFKATQSHGCNMLVPPAAAGGGGVSCRRDCWPGRGAALTRETAATREEKPAPPTGQVPP